MSVVRRIARALAPRSLRNWLRSPRDSVRFLGETLRHALGGDPVVEIRPGWRLRAHPTAWRAAYHVHQDDPPQVAELDAFLATCRPGMRLFDLGAHYGLFSLAAAHAGGDAVAVDPSAHALWMTGVVARLNGFQDRITSVHAAVAATAGEIEMVDAGVQSVGYFVQPSATHGPGERTRVPTVTVDGLAERYGAPTHLKIDVEGFEDEVLAGATRTLAAGPLVFLELHVGLMREAGKDPAAPLARLSDCGYAFQQSDGRTASPKELVAQQLVRLVARVNR